MNSFKNLAKKLWKDESAQGAAEYVLLAMVIVALVLMFKERIRTAFKGRVEALGGQLDSFNGGDQ